MAGYASDWSMSNNAVDAYSRGLRPMIPEWAEDAAAVAAFANEWRRRRTDAEDAGRSSAEPVKARVAYTVWDERKRPRQVEEYALVIGAWAHTESGRRKRTGGSHFRVVERYGRAPRGTAVVFAGIASSMGPKSKERSQR